MTAMGLKLLACFEVKISKENIIKNSLPMKQLSSGLIC